MDFVNYTPFPHLVFESRRRDDRPMGVLVLRGTFGIVSGGPLRPVPEQMPVALCNVYRGDPTSSSLIAEADLAPFKPRTDIHVNAIARAPGGEPCAQWPVRIRVGTRTKDLLVRGAHEWQHREPNGWSKTRPRPCLEVELSYEKAFGGSFRVEGQLLYDEANPAGTGWIPPQAPRDKPIRAPQVVAPDEPDHVPGKRYAPQGGGPMLPHWSARRYRAGTFDERWRATRLPLPEDFDESFYNSAHPDLIYDGYLAGGEPIELVGLSAHAPVIRAVVPRYDLYAWTAYKNGINRAFGLALDTIHIDVAADDPGAHRVSLIWRARFPLPESIARLQVRMRDRSGRALAHADLEGAEHG